MTFDEFLGHFQGVRRRDAHQVQALCPAHEDREPSLSITSGDDGRILLHCHADCTLDEILAAAELAKQDLFPARSDAPAREIAYDYVDEDSTLLFQAVRRPGKKFFLRRPDGKGGWTYKLGDVRRVPYRLPTLLRADPSAVVYIVEGEKDADNLGQLGEVTTTNPGGAGNSRLWATAPFREPLRDRAVVVVPDNDDRGSIHAEHVAQALHGCAQSLKVLSLPDLPAKGDVSDWIAAGGTRKKLAALVAACEPWKPSATLPRADLPSGREEEPDRERPTQARLLVALAQEHADLFKTPSEGAYAAVKIGDHLETWAIRSKGFRMFLNHKFFLTYDRTPSAQAFKEAIDTLETLAALGSLTRIVALRVGEQDQRLFVDLCDSTWQVVEIKPGGWRVVGGESAPLRFRRTSTMCPLPEPKRGGSIECLRQFLNTGEEEWRWQLMLAWLLFTYQPRGPFPVLVLQGEQGCAKSTAARVLRAMIDPSQAPLRLPPKDEDKLLVGAKSSWVLVFDNLSGMPIWLSDSLCCLATGTAQSKRVLYTDDEEHIIVATRPVIVNGIDDMTARPDFASRALAVDLPQIRDEHRREEAHFWHDFEKAQPAILGAIFSTLARILAIRDEVVLPCKPRMADFARFGVAAEQVLGWPKGSFLAAYQESQADSDAVALESNLVALAAHHFMTNPDLDFREWRGTASALLPRLAGQLDAEQARSRAWPVNASQLGNQLRRSAPILRGHGIHVRQLKVHGERIWHLAREAPESRAEASSPASPSEKGEQRSLFAQGCAGDGTGECPAQARYPEVAGVTAGDGRVTAEDATWACREGDGGDAGDGATSCPSGKEGKGAHSLEPDFTPTGDRL